MQTKRIELLLATSPGLFAETVEAPFLPGQTDMKLPNTLPDSVQAGFSYKELGKADAAEISTEEGKSDRFKRERLIERAEKLAGLPAADDWFEGYGSFFSTDKNDGTRKTRVSEARAVFEAWHKPAAGTIDEAREQLRDFKGHYNQWVDLARQIRGKKSTGRKEGSGNTVPSTTQMKAIETAIPKMTVAQAKDVVEKATVQLAKGLNGEIALIRHMVNVTLAQLASSQDKGIAKAAEDSRERWSGILKAAEDAEQLKKQQAAATDKTKVGDQPIEVPQPVQQSQQPQTNAA
jgi:hypothetical protein